MVMGKLPVPGPPTNLDKSRAGVYCACSGCGGVVWIFLGGGRMVLGKLPAPGRPTILIAVGQGPTALAVGAGGGCMDIIILIYPFSPVCHSLWETTRYRLKYCLKEPLNPNQPTNLDIFTLIYRGWSGSAMVLGKLPVPGCPTIWIQ